RYANYLLGATAGLPVALATPSLYTIYQRPPRLRNALVLGISQSGKSPDIVSVLVEARRQGALTAAFTNVVDSDLGRQADHVIDLCAGEEKAVAASKTYTSSLAAVALLGALLGDDAAMRAELTEVPDAVAAALTTAPSMAQIAERYRYMRDCVVIGRGYNYATAFELALKLKELTYTIAEPYSSADFRHGPMAILEPGFPVILIGPSGALTARLREFAGLLTERGAELL
ncbi:MAG: SIS domain-containing protein, partial [Caldilineaceae bacterium]|nr:SIS domain-containing protein [Caldilineaceae bacterium]